MADEIIQKTRQDLENIQVFLITIERRNDENEVRKLIRDTEQGLVKIDAQLHKLDSQIYRETASFRQNNKITIEQLKSDIYLVKSSFNTIKTRFENQCRRAMEKEELLKRRFTTNNETRLNMGFDHELNTNEHLKQSTSLIDQMLLQGAHILEDLENQKSALFSIRKRFHFVAKSIGISDTTLRLIDKRVKEDWKLFVFGVIFCMIFMVMFYLWWMG
ncbi:unnamed protein product [Caenorhabditis angaria]|uniref:Uncharacterized protein n=1 Tax=Caenorhabditis angaria TaxID=860376 RepID=A0A9P1IS25_9PELO|nr:unnamed protein product [Caenorhabditis angaria]